MTKSEQLASEELQKIKRNLKIAYPKEIDFNFVVIEDEITHFFSNMWLKKKKIIKTFYVKNI